MATDLNPPGGPALLDQCNPRFLTVEDSCGCTITRASIKALKPTDMVADNWKEKGMDRIVANTKEARMVGVPESALTDLLLSRMTPITRISLSESPQGSVIAPYILKPQRTRVNANYFKMIKGRVDPAAGGANPASAWQIVVGNHDDGGTGNADENKKNNWASPLTNVEKYFLPGRYITVIWTTGTPRADCTVPIPASADQAVHRAQFKILTATPASGSGDVSATGKARAVITLEPSVSSAGWATFSKKSDYQPAGEGLVIPMANSVSNYEQWCEQDPAENTWKLKAFWMQTIRRTHCYNEEYVKALMAQHTTASFKKFRQLTLADQKRRQMYLAERAWWNTMFFGQEIDENQAVETYEALPQVTDPSDGSCVIEYKANTVGWHKQLDDCGRVIPLLGGPLDMDQIKDMLYQLKRVREAGGATVTRIDAMTDRWTAGNILTVMIDYYKKKYGADTTRFYQPNQALTFNNQVLWNYNIYQFPDEGVELAVIHDQFFDDLMSATPVSQKTAGRYLWMIDWSDIWLGVGGAKSAARQTNVADNMYNCVITPVVTHYQLYSETVCAGLDDPNRHAIFTDFNDKCPCLTVAGCKLSDLTP